MFFVETCTIEDVSYYNPNTYTSSQKITDYTVPENFKIRFTCYTTTHNDCKININNSAVDYTGLSIGAISDQPFYNGVVIYLNSQWTIEQNTVIMPLATEVTVECTYNNGVITFTALGETITFNKKYTVRNNFNVSVKTGYIKDIRIIEL